MFVIVWVFSFLNFLGKKKNRLGPHCSLRLCGCLNVFARVPKSKVACCIKLTKQKQKTKRNTIIGELSMKTITEQYNRMFRAAHESCCILNITQGCIPLLWVYYFEFIVPYNKWWWKFCTMVKTKYDKSAVSQFYKRPWRVMGVFYRLSNLQTWVLCHCLNMGLCSEHLQQ